MGKSCPVLCIADLNKGAVIVYAGVPPHISPGQVSQMSLYLTILLVILIANFVLYIDVITAI